MLTLTGGLNVWQLRGAPAWNKERLFQTVNQAEPQYRSPRIKGEAGDDDQNLSVWNCLFLPFIQIQHSLSGDIVLLEAAYIM